jgi:hypothetical protein
MDEPRQSIDGEKLDLPLNQEPGTAAPEFEINYEIEKEEEERGNRKPDELPSAWQPVTERWLLGLLTEALWRTINLTISPRSSPPPGRIHGKTVVAGIPEFLQMSPEYPIAEAIGTKTGKRKMKVDSRNSWGWRGPVAGSPAIAISPSRLPVLSFSSSGTITSMTSDERAQLVEDIKKSNKMRDDILERAVNDQEFDIAAAWETRDELDASIDARIVKALLKE